MPETMTAADRYATLKNERSPYLNRAREAAELTIPSLIPPEGSDGADLPNPFQSVGARGVNHLSSKLLLTLFPPQGSFFRLTVSKALVDELEDKSEEGTDIHGEVEKSLSSMERAIKTEMDGTNLRTKASEAFKHLLVGGNYCLQENEDGSYKGHPLTDYVVKRDLEDNIIDVVILEELSPMSLPEKIRDMVNIEDFTTDPEDESEEKSVKLYTRMTRDTGNYKVHQEVEGEVVEGSEGTWPLKAPAIIPLRWNPVDGSSYGRGLATEYMGDLLSLESMTQSVVEFSAAASKIVWLNNPGGQTDSRDLRDASSGDFVDGDARDITLLMLEKFADFQITKAVADDTKERVEEAFLLNSSIQRSAERVTAEEIRFMAGELEQALGGTYTSLSDELQRPLVNRVTKRMQKDGGLPRLPKDTIKPKIITGIEGLGRQSDFQKLRLFVQDLGTNFGPKQVATYVNLGTYARRALAALGLEEEGLVRSEEEVQAAIERQRRAQRLEKLGPEALKSSTKLAEKRADIQSQQKE